MRNLLVMAATLTMASAASAQTGPTITLYEFPAYLGRSVTIAADTPDLAANEFARRARSARVVGEWRICPATNFGGQCRTVTADQPVLTRSQVVSVRAPALAGVQAASGTAGSTTAIATTASTTAATASIAVDPGSLDVGNGADGQDATFYARPTLSGTDVSAGTNDLAAATAFCKLAGATQATAAGRARVQTSSIIDVTAQTRVRGFALRDVLCRK